MSNATRDQDMDMLKTLIQHTAKEIFDAMISTSGYYIAQNADETLQHVLLMKRAIELMDELYRKNNCLSVIGESEHE